MALFARFHVNGQREEIESVKNKISGRQKEILERFTIENVQPLCKDLPANPCREFVAGGLCPP